MREIPFEGEFDAVINISLPSAISKAIPRTSGYCSRCTRQLRPGGRLLLELIDRVRWVRDFQPFGVQRREDGLLVIEERRFDQRTGRGAARVTLIYPDGHRSELGHDARVYTPTELAEMLSRAGMDVETEHGGLDGRPLTLESRRLVVIATTAGSV